MLLFTHVELDAARFSTMSPELRTEAVRLAVERGATAARIARAVGLTAGEVRAISAETHAYQLSTAVEVDDGDDGAVPEVKPGKSGGRPPGQGTGYKILDLLLVAGNTGLAASTQMLASSLSVSERQVNRAMSRLLDDACIERMKPSTGKAPTVWAITEAGKVALEAVAERRGR